VLNPVLLMPYFVLCTVGLLRDYARSSGLTNGSDRDTRVERVCSCSQTAWLSRAQERGPLPVHVDYAFDRLLESKLARGLRYFWCPLGSGPSLGAHKGVR